MGYFCVDLSAVLVKACMFSFKEETEGLRFDIQSCDDLFSMKTNCAVLCCYTYRPDNSNNLHLCIFKAELAPQSTLHCYPCSLDPKHS